MRVLFLGNINKAHVRRWVDYLKREQVDLHVISDAPAPDENHPGVPIHTPKWGFLQNLWTYRLHRAPHATSRDKWRVYAPLIKRINPTILHAHEALIYGPVLPHFPKYHRVLTPWGPDFQNLREPESPAGRLVLAAARAADVIITNAPGMEEEWSRLTGMPRERFDLFSWGVDLAHFKPREQWEMQDLRERLSIPATAPLLLSPRLANRLYRIPMLLEAWHRARTQASAESRIHDARFLVLRAGATDEDWRHVEETANRLSDSSIVLHAELLDRRDIAAAYSTSGAVAMAPEHDLLAMSLLEALACGAQVIVPPLPCYRAVAEPENGTVIFANPTIEDFAAAFLRWGNAPPPDRAKPRAAVLRHHDAAQCEGRMLEIYRQLASR